MEQVVLPNRAESGCGDSEFRGLSSDEARRRLEEYGANVLPEPPQLGPLTLLLRQFLSPFIYILIVAAGVSFILGQTPSGVFIVAVLLLNAVIGTVQEISATRAAAALKKLVKGFSTVERDGAWHSLPVETVVPGDLVRLASGDKVPADLHLIEAVNLAIDESMLTGESLAASKIAGAQHVGTDAGLGGQKGRAYAGTVVVRGRGKGFVASTGTQTEIGRIAGRVTAKRDSEPPLMIRIRRFTYSVALGIGVAILALAGIMLFKGGYDAEGMALMAIGLAVSTIPEGLPAALTVALAIGMQRMAKHNVIIRKLVAVEALGSCTFICSDKTGTLTVNELTVRRLALPGGQEVEVTGEGIAPGGEVMLGDNERARRAAQHLATTALLANECQLDYAGPEWTASGDIVDAALLVLAKKLGLSLETIRHDCPEQALIPYESEKAYAGAITLNAGVSTLHVKGSPERILAACDHAVMDGAKVPLDIEAVRAQAESLAERGYRVLAFARKATSDAEDMAGMEYLGLTAMIDPIRPEAKEAIARCRKGGVDVAMVTGDHALTARAISVELGLCEPGDLVVTGAMLREAGEGEAAEALIRSSRVFARIEPSQKEQIVKSFMRDGHFVAVTGDGVNDAPAMRAANTGIAMGKRGTDVARESADLIITDDNFASIVDGIEQGRIVYNNIRKVIGLLVATGFSALLLFFLTALFGLPMPLTAVQLLWLNLVANGLQDVALAFEPKEGGELNAKPRRPSEPVFERHLIQHVLIVGGVMGVLAFGVYSWLMGQGTEHVMAQNLTLMLMVLFGNIHALSSRSERKSIFKIPFFANPFLVLAVPLAQVIHIGAMYIPGLNSILGLSPISLDQWLILLGIALTLLVVEELHKWLSRHSSGS